MNRKSQLLGAFNPLSCHCPVCHTKQVPVDGSSVGVSTSSTIQTMEHHEPQLHWQNIIVIARPPEFSLITWILPPKGKMTSKTEPSCLSFSKIQHLEATDSPSLFSTCIIMTENELSPLKSSGGCGSSAFTTGQVFTQSCTLASVILGTVEEEGYRLFVFPLPVVFTLTYLKVEL